MSGPTATVESLGFSSTAQDVVALFPNAAARKTIVITGPSPTGIGGETAVGFALAGAHTLILLGRSSSSLQPVVERIKAANADTIVKIVEVDLSSLSSVRKALGKVEKVDVDVLVNNAGIMCAPFVLTEGMVESHFAVNFLSHFVLSNLLRPKTVVHVAVDMTAALVKLGDEARRAFGDDGTFGGGRTYDELLAYANGKLCLAYFGFELARRGRGVKSIVVHPGLIISGLMKHITPTIQASSFAKLSSSSADFKPESPKSFAQGAASTLRAALDGKVESGSFVKDCQVVVMEGKEERERKGREVWMIGEKFVGERFEGKW
ncbi:NAD(P)-binding protein [Exidia glandulosa HHB12029]|uniref:NAD(P)-binding protein n=1 Tax=Exidia glandulosa HHB12029 TaxID=1314781 RepID=A0A165BE01_EXIGL|nr:NAD(P)-binding protein [Exidia glandulosa HHB12029]